VTVTSPDYEYYLNQYQTIPLVISTDVSSGGEYYNMISKRLGKSDADAMINVWETCVALSRHGDWLFHFDRNREEGVFYCQSEVAVPDELKPFIE
jgi:hypothetical protein